ncbi:MULTISPECIES: ABC transporter substrate-binding protein [unclassified Streptomyces]|uniref:ABC transporter substrate-binding protein n=1 Tax=unclassified Streptomyces TaxID=2593676 RepID=UPI002E8232C4|nr:ABC transporter substrate-binding protein [Streptomyces sp. NBC_00569]WUB91460.1 ABC transporter substrate-binding protein [Streptomyces sp. NBC_00569]
MNRSTKAALALTVSAGLALTACGGPKPTPGDKSGAKADAYAPVTVGKGYATKGGNINVLMSSDFQTLDPGNSNYVQTANVGQLYYRTLTMAKETAGRPPTIVPDLATDLGKASADGLTWTYTLKKGLKFEDGTPITSKAIKYGVERTYARDVYTQAPQELNSALADDGYKGPYAGGDFKGIDTPDDHTVVFHLKQPFAEFPALVSRSNTAPVPKDKDTKLDYTNHPVSSGPYKIKSYDRGRSMKLVRNDRWDPATDPNRPALPDTFTFTLSTAQATISQQLLADSDPTAITLDSNGGLQASDAAKLNDPKVKKRTAAGLLGCTDVLNFNTETIKDPDVRKAMALSIDRGSIQVQYGGARFGKVAQSYINPAQRGYVAQHTDLDPAGKPKLDEARKLLKGKKVPKKLVYGYADTNARYKNVGTVLQQNFKKLGIDLQLRPIPAANYYTVLAGDQMPDIARSGWCGGADSGSVRTTVDPNVGPSLDGKTYGFSNIPRFHDPKIAHDMYKLRGTNGTSEELGKKWATLFDRTMQAYPLVPLVRSYTSSVVGSKVRGAQMGYFFGAIDLSIVGAEH